jgi:hypothetical protein
MMGRQMVDQSQLFYLFNLEKRIPERHLLRRINPIVGRILAEFREKLQPFYSEIGRPSIDPELMIRMLIVGYCYGIRFERRLCEEVGPAQKQAVRTWFRAGGCAPAGPNPRLFAAPRPAILSGPRQICAPTACGRSRCHAWHCHHEAVLSADRWPDNIAGAHVRSRIVCTRCGIIGPMRGRTGGSGRHERAGTLCGAATNNAAQNRIDERGCHWLAVGEQCRCR